MRRALAFAFSLLVPLVLIALLFQIDPAPTAAAPEAFPADAPADVAAITAVGRQPAAAAFASVAPVAETAQARSGGMAPYYEAPVGPAVPDRSVDRYGPGWHRDQAQALADNAVALQTTSALPPAARLVVPPTVVPAPSWHPLPAYSARPAPLLPAAFYSTTLIGLHRNVDAPGGFSSTFVFTNTGVVSGSFDLHFGWPNDDYIGSDWAIILDPGEALAYGLDSWPLGETLFYGNMTIVGDQPFDIAITSPDHPVLQGDVVADDGVTPVQVHSVNAHRPDDEWNWYGGTYNLPDGTFYLGGLPAAADYALYIHAPYPWASQWYNGHFYDQDADLLNVSSGALSVTVTLQPGGTISGTIYAADGVTPLENVNVDVAQGGAGTCTDANGRFVLEGLPYDDYKVRAGGDWNWCLGQQSIYLTEFYADTDDPDLATWLTLDAGSDIITGIDFTLEEGGVIAGRVTDAQTGLPLDLVQVNIYDANEGWGVGGAQTTANGTYTATGLLAGDYVVAVDDGNNMPSGYARQYYSNTLAFEDAWPVPVVQGAATPDINFPLQPGGAISGTVYAADGITPLANINVDIGAGNFGTCTDDQGRYEISGLPYGDYSVVAGRDYNWCLDAQSIYAAEYWEEVPTEGQATLLPVNGTIPFHSGIDFTLELGGMITGTVTGADSGLPLADVWVSANPFDDSCCGNGAWTNAGGVYTITGLTTNDYRVRVDDQESIPPGYAFEFYQDTPSHEDATPVSVTIGSIVGGIDFALDPGGMISGLVFDEATGLPLPNMKVEFYPLGENWGWGTCTDENGYYEARVLPYRTYKVSAGGGWNWCQEQPSPYVQEFYDNTPFRQDAAELTLDGATPDIGGIDFTLEEGGFLAGNVTDTGGTPVAGLRVEAQINNGDCPWCFETWDSSDTDANGDYLLGPLPALAFGVYACADCNGQLLVSEYYDDVYDWQSMTLITVSTGITETGIDFVLDPGIWITGHVSVPPGYSNEGIPIDAWKTDGIWFGANRQTDANGDYVIPVPPIFDSRWGVSARPDGTDLGFQWAHQFNLDQESHFDFDLEIGGSIAGCITSGGGPVADLWINADAPQMSQGAQTGPDGCYEITNLPDATYHVFHNNWESGYAQAYYGGHEHPWATPLPLQTPEVLGGIDFEVPLRGQIEGYVYESDGTTPIEGVRVLAMNEAGYWEGYSQPDGYYTLDVPMGEYRLLFEQGFFDVIYKYWPNSYTWDGATQVVVGPLRLTSMPDVLLDRPGEVEGQVVDADSGTPLGGIHVAVGNIDPAIDRVHYFWSGCTDESGSFYIDRAVPGANEVLAIGTCGNYDYGLVTTTLTVLPGTRHNVALSLTAGTAPPAPFTVHSGDSFDYTPQSVGHNIVTGAAEEIVPALFEPLVQFDDNGEWYSHLLVDVPTPANGGVAVNGDHTVVTYTLQAGLLWSDGAPLTADDIRFTWEWMSLVHTHHYDEFISAGLLQKIVDVAVTDPQTAVVTYDFRVSPSDYLAAIGYLLPEHALAGQHPMDVRWNSDFAHFPVGNGPYVVVDWVPGSHLDLVANPNYVRRGAGLPAIDEMRFLFTDSQFWSLVSGNAQVSVNVLDELPPDYETYALDFFAQDDNVFFSIIPNHERPFFADTSVRQALYTALNRLQIDATHWPERSYAVSWMPTSHPLYSDTATLYPFDLGLAAAMLDAAGWVDSNSNGIRDKGGVEFQFEVLFPQGNDVRLDIVTMFQADLATIGVELIPIAVDWEELLDRATYGTADAVMIGWGNAARYKPGGFGNFHSSQVPTAYNSYQTYNYSRWRDPLNDALLEGMQTELDAAALRDLVAQQLARFSEEQPYWVTGHQGQMAVAVPTLLGIRPGGGIPLTWNIAEWELPANPYDLTVRKQLAVDSPAPQPGTTITYAVTLRNVGFFTVTEITLADTLPADVIFVRADPPPTAIDDGTLLWALGELPGNSPVETVLVVVEIPVTTTHGTLLENFTSVTGLEMDEHPGNNGFLHTLVVRDDVDLAVEKAGVGQPAVGELYSYYLDYANWGGAPAGGATLTDTLPAEVSFISADPPPDTVDGQTLSWELDPLAGNQWAGQIEITAEIIGAGTVTNTGLIGFGGVDVDPGNNSDSAVQLVDDILAPVILRPTQGTTDGTPTVSGLAPSGSMVNLYDLDVVPTWVASTTASVTGTFAVELNLPEGTYIVAATATKEALTSGLSNTVTFIVDFDVPLDTDGIHIGAAGVDISSGSVRAEVRTLAHRTVDVSALLPCAVEPSNVVLEVTENGLFTYPIPPLDLTDQGDDDWLAEFRVWLAEPHSSYEFWLEWTCDAATERELLIYILIDPDGYVYDQSLVDNGSPIADAIIVNAVVTAYVRIDDAWQVWNAALYGQTNPQQTDGTTDDGVEVAGYYSFLTPSGQYRIEARAEGYQPYRSPVLTVITTPVHLDVGLQPVLGGTGATVAPASLATSFKQVDQSEAWVGDTLTYDIWLSNDGGEPAGSFHLEDELPAYTALVTSSVGADSGTATYGSGVVVWDGAIDAGQTVHISYQVVVTESLGSPFVVDIPSSVSGPAAVLATLGDLSAQTTILNAVGLQLHGDAPQSVDPGVQVSYDFTITNTGNVTDTFSVAAVSSQEYTIGWPPLVTLAPGASMTLGVLVWPQADRPAGEVDTTILTATSSLAPSIAASVAYTTTVNQVAGLQVSSGLTTTAEAGTTVTFTHVITNAGNGTDTFQLGAISSLGWVVEVGADPTLAAGGTATVIVVVHIPDGAAVGEVDITTLTVTSTFNGVLAITVDDETEVIQIGYEIYLPAVSRN